MLKPRLVATSTSRVATVTARPDTTERIRGRKWMKIKTDVLIATDHYCVECQKQGISTIAAEVDHVVPLWKGGTNERSNLQGLCEAHHARKTAREAAERAKLR
jgi:5-methylcytosine-specific restriction protein A